MDLVQEWPTPSRPRPIVIIGAGGIVRHAHLPAYRRAGFRVAGIFDVRGEASASVAAEFGIARVFESLEAAAGEHDVVFDVAVPPGAVLEVLQCLPAGSVVLMQKPMGRDFEEACHIVECCRRRSFVAAVNFQLRFSPNMLAMRDAIDRGLLGAITDVEVRVNVETPWRLWEFLSNLPRHEILYHSIHYLDFIRSILGEPGGVHSRVVRNPDLPRYADTSSATILDYGDVCRSFVSVHHAHGFGTRHIKIEGTKGAAIAKLGVNLDYPRGRPDELEIAVAPEREWRTIPLRGDWFNHAFEGPMSNLQRYAAGEDSELRTSVDDAVHTMALVEACYRSSASGGTRLPEVAIDEAGRRC